MVVHVSYLIWAALPVLRVRTNVGIGKQLRVVTCFHLDVTLRGHHKSSPDNCNTFKPG